MASLKTLTKGVFIALVMALNNTDDDDLYRGNFFTKVLFKKDLYTL